MRNSLTVAFSSKNGPGFLSQPLIQLTFPFVTGFEWYSQGTILPPDRLSSIVEVKRIKGPIFNSKEAAEQHGFTTLQGLD